MIKTLTSTSMIKRKTNSLELNRFGFTLLEILIALALMSLVFSFALSYNFTTRQSLENEVEKIERAIRYSGDESTLRNKIIRIKFSLEETPQKFSIEFGPDDNFVLPAMEVPPKEDLTETQILAIEQRLKKLDKNFVPITDIDESNLTLDEDIQILGIGIIEDQKIVYDFSPSIYFYPNGEKDSVFIFLSSEDELIAILLTPFSSKVEKVYQTYQFNELEDQEEVKINTMKTVFEEYGK